VPQVRTEAAAAPRAPATRTVTPAQLRHGLRWPSCVPVVWSARLALKAMVQAELRAAGTRAILQRAPGVRWKDRPDVAALRDARQRALGFFPDGVFKAFAFTVPCPRCRRLVPEWYVGRGWWTCRYCAQLPMYPRLMRGLSHYLCAVRLGVRGEYLRRMRHHLLHVMSQPPKRIETVVALGAAAYVLQPNVWWQAHPHFLLGRRTFPLGVVHRRLSVLYTRTMWDWQTCPEAAWRRSVLSVC
jgi:hypothetical protein